MPDSLCFLHAAKGIPCLHKGNAILRIFAALSMGEFVKDKYRKDARGRPREMKNARQSECKWGGDIFFCGRKRRN